MIEQILFSRYAYGIFFLLSLSVMVFADFILDEKAEYLNAWHFILVLLKRPGYRGLHFIFMQSQSGVMALLFTAGILLLIHSVSSYLITKTARYVFLNLC